MEHYPKFPNQRRDPISAVYEDNEPYYGDEDTQLELYVLENTEDVTFNKFSGYERSVKKI